MFRDTMSQATADAHGALALAGRVVLVTGASSGIGRAIALAAAREGADLIATFRRNEAGGRATAADIGNLGRKVRLEQADISRQEDIDRLAMAAVESFGRVDAWINNAGADILTGEAASLPRLDKLDRLLAVDVRGTMMASWAAADLMQRQPAGGTIINMSWDGAITGLEGENPELFSAMAGAILSYSKSLARSAAPKVRVNVLGPGWIETAFGEGAPQHFKDRIRKRIPLARWGTPEDVARAAVFLASDAARYVTGQMIMVNGGEVM
jgi:3-oxoacyl-[acyl-carrier protein] reductase